MTKIGPHLADIAFIDLKFPFDYITKSSLLEYKFEVYDYSEYFANYTS